jgi:hypothetical protein
MMHRLWGTPCKCLPEQVEWVQRYWFLDTQIVSSILNFRAFQTLVIKSLPHLCQPSFKAKSKVGAKEA